MALRCRKNQSSLTAPERARFVAAVLALKANGKYDQHVQAHMGAMAAAHRGPAFFPWHREYLRRFELDLQTIDSTVTLPYWDWTVDRSGSASIWGLDFMGGDGRPSDGQVMTGPFAFATGNWTLAFDGPFLWRRFGVSAPALPTPADVTAAMGDAVYDVAPYTRFSTSGFRNRLEGWISGPQLHNLVHVWVGGSMGPMSSPNDPVFFLHHCFVDKLWADWQRAHPGSPYLPVTGAAPGHNLADAMSPWAALGQIVTPASVLDHHALGYAYDNEAECRPVIKPTLDKPALDTPVTLKFRDDSVKPRLDKPAVDTPVTLKFRDDSIKPVVDKPVSDTPVTLKFRDDISKPPGDVPNVPGPGLPFRTEPAGARPFILSTPHHSQAWESASQEASVLSHLETALVQIEQALRAGQAELAQMDAEYRRLLAEYEAAGGKIGGCR